MHGQNHIKITSKSHQNHIKITSKSHQNHIKLLLVVTEVGWPETSGQDADNDDRHLGNRIISESAGHVAR